MSFSFSSLFKSITQGVVTTFDEAWGAVAHIFSNDVEPFLKQTAALIERNGGSLLLEIATQAVPDIATENWTVLTAQIVSDVKAAGAPTLAAEEQLAASTALQMAQNVAAALTATANAIASTTAAPAVTPPPAEPESTSTSTPAAEPAADPNAPGTSATDASASTPSQTPADAESAQPAAS